MVEAGTYKEPSCFTGRSGLCVPREVLEDLGAGAYQWVGGGGCGVKYLGSLRDGNREWG